MPKTIKKPPRKSQNINTAIKKPTNAAATTTTTTKKTSSQPGSRSRAPKSVIEFFRPIRTTPPCIAVKELLISNGFPRNLISKAGFTPIVSAVDCDPPETTGNEFVCDSIMSNNTIHIHSPQIPLLYRNTETNLYHDLRYPESETRNGITRLLRSLYFSNYEHLAKVRRVSGSGLSKGSRFHKQMYHRIMCEDMCVCRRKYGSPTSRAPGKKMSLWVDQAFKALGERGIVPFACEVIVSIEHIATEIDILAWHGHPSFGRLANVSLKTGYSKSSLKTPRTTDGSGYMLSVLDGKVKNSDFEQHQLQQHIENLLLSVGHGVKICDEENYVLYVGLDKDKAIIETLSEWRSDQELCSKLAADFLCMLA